MGTKTQKGLNLTLITACFPQPTFLLEYVLIMTKISPFLAHDRNLVWTEAAPINSHSTKYPRPVPGWRTNLEGIQ